LVHFESEIRAPVVIYIKLIFTRLTGLDFQVALTSLVYVVFELMCIVQATHDSVCEFCFFYISLYIAAEKCPMYA